LSKRKKRKSASVVSIYKKVFLSLHLKVSTDAEPLTDWCRAFHGDAAATAKERPP